MNAAVILTLIGSADAAAAGQYFVLFCRSILSQVFSKGKKPGDFAGFLFLIAR